MNAPVAIKWSDGRINFVMIRFYLIMSATVTDKSE